MKLLIAGSKGQLAREIAAQAADAGYEVEGFDVDELSISDFGAVVRKVSAAKPDLLINCAAYNNVDGAEQDWENAFLANGIGVKNLAIASAEAGAVFVHYGTDFVFNGEKRVPYTIADMPDPISSYGQSKLLGEELLQAHGTNYYLIRTSWLFGDGAFSFPLKVQEWAAKNDKLRIVDDQVASPTYCADLAEATLKLVKTGAFGLYHITNSGHCSRYEWARHILEVIGWKGTLEPAKSAEFKTPARRPEYSVLDNFPLQQTIGSLLPSWQDATERFIRKTKESGK